MSPRSREAAPAARTAVDWAEVHARVEEATRRLATADTLAPEEAARVLAERARALAQPAVAEPEEGAWRQFLLVALGGQRLGVDSGCVAAVLRGVHPTPLPGATPPVTSIVLWRGRLLACLGTAPSGAAPAEAAEGRRLVVLEAGGAELALLVDTVDELVEVATSDIHPAPAGAADLPLLGLTTDALPLLDARALLRRHGTAR